MLDNFPSNAELASMSATTRRSYLAQLRQAIRAASLEVQEARKARKAHLDDVRHRCSLAKVEARRRWRQIRDAYLREVDQWKANEKAKVTQICQVEMEEIRAKAADAVKKAKAKRLALARRKSAIENLSGEAEKRRKEALKRREREQEQDDFVEGDVEGWLPGAGSFFRKHARTLFAPSKKPAKMSRAEWVVHHLENNPELLAEWRNDQAEQFVRDAEAKEAAYYAELERAQKADKKAKKRKPKVKKRRKTTTADDVPF